MKIRRIALLATVTALSTVPLSAQFSQYTPPGDLAQRPPDLREHIERAASEARWRLGPLHLDPWIGVRNITFVDNVFDSATVAEVADPEMPLAAADETIADLTATVGLGLRGYVRTGPKVILAAHALPEYVWWQDLEDRRQNVGRYGAGAFFLFNRMTVEASARRDEGQRIVSSEFEQLVTSRDDLARISFDVESSDRFGFFGSFDLLDSANLVDDSLDPRLRPLNELNREERVARVGFRIKPRPTLSIGFGIEDSDVVFEQTARALSNSGLAPTLQIVWERSNEFVDLSLALRDLGPDGDSDFVPYDEPTGSLLIGLHMQGPYRYSLYAGRSLVYSVRDDSLYYEDTRIGGAISVELGWRTNLRLFAETGTQDYTAVESVLATSSNDITTFGADVGLRFNDRVALFVRAVRTDFSSADPNSDRSTTRIASGINFGGGSSPWW